MKSLCNRRVSVWNPDTLQEIVRFVHEVHPVFAITLSTFSHMRCGWNDDTMPTFNLFGVHFKCFSISGSYSSKKSELVDPEIEKHYKWTLKRLKVGMVSSFHPHSMFKKVERLKAKTGCTSCTKRTISFEVSGFHTETHLLQRDFIFLNLFKLRVFLFSKCTIQSHIIIFQSFLTSFVIFHAFTNYFEL